MRPGAAPRPVVAPTDLNGQLTARTPVTGAMLGPRVLTRAVQPDGFPVT